jgi:ketosteroid isomerase-like protein
MEQNELIARQWFAAFNAHDLEGILALYADNAVHYSPKLKVRQPETEGLIQGKAALRAWWKDSFERIPSLQYVPTLLTANTARVFMEYVRKADGDADMLVAEALEVIDGRITSSRVYHG